MMGRFLSIAMSVQLAACGSLSAQQMAPWQILGDTSGAPSGCTAAAGVIAISAWFAAFQKGDSAGLARTTAAAYRSQFVFSTGRFIQSEPFFVTRTFRQLLSYSRQRTRRHERITIQRIWFNGWRGRGLQFGPIYFIRSADDLGSNARQGVGKGEYRCGSGLSVLNLGPRPGFDSGPH